MEGKDGQDSTPNSREADIQMECHTNNSSQGTKNCNNKYMA